MKQLNFLERKQQTDFRLKTGKTFCRSWYKQSRMVLIWVFLAVNLFSGYAQIGWIDQGVSLSAEQMTVQGPNETLTIAFIPEEDLEGAKIVVTQPVGVNYSTHTGEVNNISLKPARTVSTTDGIQTNTFTYTSFLNKNEPVVLQVVLATIRTAEEGDIIVSIQNKEEVELNTKTCFLRMVVPDIVVSTDEPVKEFTSTSDAPQRFELNLTASVGEATSCRIWLETDMYSKLENFYLGDKELTVAEPTIINATKKSRYTVIVTANDLDGGKLTQSPQILSFDASSIYGGDHTITSISNYPNTGANSNILSQVSGAELTIRYPAEAGAPDIAAPDFYFTTSSDPETKITKASNRWWKLPFHGNPSDPNILHAIFTNNGVDAYELKTTISTGVYGYMDLDNIYYQIDEGIRTKLEREYITVKYTLQTTYSSYANYISEGPCSITVTFPSDVTLPANSQLHIEIPVVNGQIFDNTTVDTDYAGNYLYSVSAEAMTAVSKGGTANNGKPLSYYTANSYPPYLPAVLGEIQLKSGETSTVNIPITPSYTNSTYGVSQEFFVRIPEWLKLTESNPIRWINNTDGSTWYESTIPTPVIEIDGSKTYTWEIAGTLARTNCTVTFDYTADDFSPDEPNKEGTIKYGANFIVGSEKFESITQRFQKVTLLCKKDGIELNGFKSIRKTVGLRDTNNDGIPDSDEKALPEDGIRNDLFLIGDIGELVWNAVVLENGFSHLYLPITTTTNNLFHKSIQSGHYTVDETEITLTISRNGEPDITESMIYHEVSGSTILRYLSFHKDDFVFKEGDQLEIHLPFQVRSGVNNVSFYPVTTECFLTSQAVTDPFAENVEGRVGTDKATLDMKAINIRNYVYNTGSSGYNFYNTETPGIDDSQMWYFFPLYNTGIPAGYFPFEVRQTSYPREFSFEFPEGYELVNLRITEGESSSNAKVIDITPTIEGNTYTYNFENKFSVDGAGSTIIYPEGNWRMYVYGTVKATQSAPSGRSAIPYKVIYHNFYGENTPETINEGTAYFNYLGVGTSLDLASTELPALSGRLSTPLTVGNPNDFDIQDIWLYIDGNVSSIELAGSGGSMSITGTGTNGRWFHLPQLPATKGLSYTLSFIYEGDAIAAETVKVYTFTGFNETWDNIFLNDPSFDPSNETHARYRSAIRQIRILPTSSVIKGQIRTSLENTNPRSKLTYNTSYTVSASVNSRSSNGEIRNPSIQLNIPAGQIYNGSATITWNGTTEEVQGTLISELEALSDVGGIIELDVAEALGFQTIDLPGRLGASSQLEARFDISFKPDCETPLDGFRFEGTLAGTTPFDGIPKGNGENISSAILLPAINSYYSFDVTASFENGITAFNEYRKEATLEIGITRKGTTDNTAADDVLRLRVPREMTVNESSIITIESTQLGINLSNVAFTSSVDEDTDTRTLLVKLPVDQMNAVSGKGNGQSVNFRIPLIWDGDMNRLIEHPVQEIQAAVISNQSFGAGCTPKPADIGSVEPFNIAWVATASPPLEAQVGVSVSMTIDSDGFEGAWYRDADGTNQLSGSENNPWNFIASASDVGVTPFWVSAVFGGIHYGYVPVAMDIYPSLNYTLTSTVSLCDETSYDIPMLQSLVSNLAAGVDVKFYQSNNDDILTGEITDDISIAVSRSVWVQSFVTAKPDKKGEPQEIRFTMIPPVSIDEDLDDSQVIYIDFGSSRTISIQASNQSGYAWYKDDALIDGEQTNRLVVTEAGVYYAYALSASCSNVKSNEVTVEIYPSLDITVNTPLYICDNAGTGVDLTDYISSQTGVILEFFEGDSKLASSVVKPSVTTTYLVMPKNAGGTYGTTEEIVVTVEKSTKILSQPTGGYLVNGILPLQVIAEGENLTYQWQKEVNSIFTDINTATEAIYEATETGRYRVKVSGTTTSCGTTTVESQAANVSTYIPPQQEMYRITTEASFGDIRVTLYPNTNWALSSGSYLDAGATVQITATPSPEWAGLELALFTANGEPIVNGQLLQIWENTHIHAKFQVDGHDPDPDDPTVGNATADGDETKVWVANEILYIQTNESQKGYVISLSGTIVAARDLTPGENRFWLPSGAYIVRIGKQVTKVMVR